MHFVAVVLFIIVTVAYFSPQFDDYGLKQHDIEMFKGMSNEISHHREETGEEPLWTNSMFGGMPATQISVLHKGNIVKSFIAQIVRIFPSPSGVLLLHLVCFYLLAIMLRIKPIIGILGAFAFAFASYEIIILQAGHNSKAFAVAFLPVVLGAFIYAYRTNWKWGAILSALFMTMELSQNHFQVTYYLGILLFFLGFYFLVEAVKKKKIKEFGFATVGILVGYGLALFINYGNIKMTNDYAKDTIRGGNDVTIATDGTISKITTKGLDKEYITQWSYGVGESFTLVSPYVKGSHSAALGSTHLAEIAESTDLSRNSLKEVMNLPLYWGEQPITSGPVYLGVIVVFLALLGLVFLKDRMKWVFFGVTILALMLSWGKNFMGLTDFFIDNVPGYNKFRTVTIILVLVELIFPVLGILLLQKFYDEREELKAKKKHFLITSGAFLAFLIAVTVVGLGDNYTSSGDDRIVENYRNGMLDQISGMDPAVLLQQYRVDIRNEEQVNEFIDAQMEPIETSFGDLKMVRAEIFTSSMTRSILFAFFGIAIVALFFFTKLPSSYIVAGLIVLVLVDLVTVDVNYLGAESDSRGKYVHWVPKTEQLYPISSLPADLEIMNSELAENPELGQIIASGESKGKKRAAELECTGVSKARVIDSYKFAALNRATNYRVFDYNGGWGSSRASYFHKSLGGYHGAKLRNIQNLFEFHISRSNNKVLNMLNVKYFIQGDKLQKNNQAMGNAWMVETVRDYETADDEIRALGKKFHIENLAEGQLIVNDEKVANADVYGGEYMKYVLPNGDSLDVPLSNGLSKGLKALFVMDVNGTTNLVPEATFQLDTASSFARIASIEVTEDFFPEKEAVMLKSESEKLSKKQYSAEGTVEMTAYAPNELVYQINVKDDHQLVVFSEIYYKDGWKAFVDGKEQGILKVDYLLRGLELKQGQHKVEFKFDIPKYHTAKTMATIGSVLIVSLILGMLFFEWRASRAEAKS